MKLSKTEHEVLQRAWRALTATDLTREDQMNAAVNLNPEVRRRPLGEFVELAVRELDDLLAEAEVDG